MVVLRLMNVDSFASGGEVKVDQSLLTTSFKPFSLVCAIKLISPKFPVVVVVILIILVRVVVLLSTSAVHLLLLVVAVLYTF